MRRFRSICSLKAADTASACTSCATDATAQQPNETTTRRGFTLVEMLVTITIIGILVAITLPAVQRVRATARNTQCKNKLKQMGAALQNHYSQFEYLPQDGERGWGFGVYLFPHLDQSPLYEKLDPLSTPLTNTTSGEPEKTGVALAVFACDAYIGSNPLEPSGFGRSTYRGTKELFALRARLTDVIDGESNTIAVGEIAEDHAWALPGTGTCDAPPNSGGSYGSFHSGGANFVLCDGAVRFISENVDAATFQALETTAGGETLGEF